jgi:hypothetical protein
MRERVLRRLAMPLMLQIALRLSRRDIRRMDFDFAGVTDQHQAFGDGHLNRPPRLVREAV